MDAIQNQVIMPHNVDALAEDSQKAFKTFLEKFKCGDSFKYIDEAQRMVESEKNSLPISFSDLMEFHLELSEAVMISFFRLHPFLCKTTNKFVNEQVPNTEGNQRDYMCHFIDFPAQSKLRDLETGNLGKLLRFRAQVIRSHAVHPELVFGAFQCTECSSIVNNVEQEFNFTKPSICPNAQCMNRSKFELISKDSKFVDFQKVRVQETQDELPKGSVPRSIDIILRGDTVETAQPGDFCEFIGTLIVIPDISQMSMPGMNTMERRPIKPTDGYDTGVKGLKSLGVRELTYKLGFLACHVATVNNKYLQSEDMRDGGELTYERLTKKLTLEELRSALAMSQDTDLVTNLCNSLFPTICGSDEIKRGLLLMLFGGVPKVTTEGTKLRGDLNVCIVGDPSTAKSQFLRRVAAFAPRAVYTSGKASSAAGLTAAVVRDQESGEFVIEAGALMLANNGICCIDEFDKMDVRDQVAIHEAMEQQTISITKAGIKATLNARTSVLAAANPVGGRYDRSRSLRHNIALSAPIMSRFDLFFVLVDECSDQVDEAIATRIVRSQRSSGIEQQARRYTDDDIQRYMTLARCFEPKITIEAFDEMRTGYKRMRQGDADSGNRSAWRITVRQLESLIRLSEAFARLRMSDMVEVEDVRQAMLLLDKSIIRIEQPDIVLGVDAPVVVPAVAAEQGDDPMGDADFDEHQKQTISYDEYNRITVALVTHLRSMEDDDENGVAQIKKNDLVEWYLGTIVDSIVDEDMLLQKTMMTDMVIQRLVDKDNVLMAVYCSNVIGGNDDQPQVDKENPIISLHPNVGML